MIFYNNRYRNIDASVVQEAIEIKTCSDLIKAYLRVNNLSLALVSEQ